jgi:predicted ArsR family transcriptional regulator
MGAVEDPPRKQSRDGAARIERALRAAGGGLTMRELVSATGLHENAVRRALAGLTARGAVDVEPERRHSRGRPALRYRHAGSPDEPFRKFLPLLVELLDTSPATDDTAYAIGRTHAEATAARTPGGAREAVVSWLVTLGFAPRQHGASDTGRAEFRLHRCPFGEAVTSSPGGRRICALHHGLVAGVAEANGGTLQEFVINDPRLEPCRVAVLDTPAA